MGRDDNAEVCQEERSTKDASLPAATIKTPEMSWEMAMIGCNNVHLSQENVEN